MGERLDLLVSDHLHNTPPNNHSILRDKTCSKLALRECCGWVLEGSTEVVEILLPLKLIMIVISNHQLMAYQGAVNMVQAIETASETVVFVPLEWRIRQVRAYQDTFMKMVKIKGR